MSMNGNGARQYNLISADGHFNEPGDLFTSRVPKKYRDAVPRIESFEKGDAWIKEGAEPRPFGWGACAGKAPDELWEWARFEDINPGSYDPKARAQEMDFDGVDAEVLYQGGGGEYWVTPEKDPEFHLAMVRAYNDFVVEFCSFDPGRFGGLAMLPNRGIDQALGEIERLADKPGIAAWLLRCYPHGDTTIQPEDDAVWAAVVESGKPLTIHIALNDVAPGRVPVKRLPGTVHFNDAPRRMLEFIFTGVLDRFPSLVIAFGEVDCGWLPYFAEQCDDNYRRHARSGLRDLKLSRLPSEYMKEHFPASFITDTYAIENRHRVGVERMLWSNDYPHITSDWPNSWKTINAAFANVPAEERHAILAGNAMRVYGFGK